MPRILKMESVQPVVSKSINSHDTLTCNFNFTRLSHADAIGGHTDVRSHRRDVILQHQDTLVGVASRLVVLQRVVFVLEAPVKFRLPGAAVRYADQYILVVDLLSGDGARGFV